MRALVLLGLCVVLAGCASPRRSDRSEISSGDLAMFNKTFEGTLVDTMIEDYTRAAERPWYSFSTPKVTGTCLKIKVRNAAGKTRVFFDYSEDERRIRVLKNYYRDLAKGASVVVDLGPMDENKAEELFDSISVKSI